ncbi:MAG TPA: NDP-sugar synthase [Candidatus Binataceae bacterium]|nr:NDP-sugar synthase [Candidatus Binataceae bacterium]
MRALVLAAGLGERLRPLTNTTPKPMLPVGGRPLIHYPLRMLRRAGVTEVAINVHHLAGRIQDGLGDGSRLGMTIHWAPEATLLGTGGPLVGLRDYLGGDTFVIANSDTILDLDLAAMIAFHRARGAVATIALFNPPNLAYYSRLEIDATARIRRIRLLMNRDPLKFDDYPTNLSEDDARGLSPFMYCGVIVAEPAVMDGMPSIPPWSLMDRIFGPMVAAGRPVFGYVHRGLFRTADDLKSYDSLCAEFGALPPPQLADE